MRGHQIWTDDQLLSGHIHVILRIFAKDKEIPASTSQLFIKNNQFPHKQLQEIAVHGLLDSGL